MSRPTAYDPQSGFRFQLLTRNPSIGRAWEHCDYAADSDDRRHLLDNYRLAYGAGWEFRSILLPIRCWPARIKTTISGRFLGLFPGFGRSV